MFSRFFLLFIFSLSSSLIAASTKVYDVSRVADEEIISLGLYSYIFQDETSNLSLKEIASDNVDWYLSDQDVPSFSFTHGAYWVKLRLKNTSAVELERILLFDYAMMDEVDFYLLDNYGGIYKTAETGSHRSFDTREFDDPAFAFTIDIPPHEERVVYMRLVNDGVVQSPLYLSTKSAFDSTRSTQILTIFGLITIICVLGLFNLVMIFLPVKDLTFLYFTVLSFSAAAMCSLSTGISVSYFNLDLGPLNEKLITMFIGFMIMAGCLIPTAHYKTKNNYPGYHKLFVFLATLAFFSTLTVFVFDHKTRTLLSFGLGVISISCAFINSVHMSLKNKAGAGSFLFAWLLFLIGALLIIFNRSNWVPRSDITEHGILVALMVGLIVLCASLFMNLYKSLYYGKKASEIAEGLFNNSLEAMFTASQSGQIQKANSEFYRLLSIEETEVVSSINFKSYIDIDWDEIVTNLSLSPIKFSDINIKNMDGDSLVCKAYFYTSDDGQTVSGGFIDVTDTVEKEKHLVYLSTHDHLTGLPNRRAVEAELARCQKKFVSDGEIFSIIFIDLDQFKEINDHYGHHVGDTVLTSVVSALSKLKTDSNFLARVGGDEFIWVLPGCDLMEAEDFALELSRTLHSTEIRWKNNPLEITASMGITVQSSDGPVSNMAELVSYADGACFTSKQRNGNQTNVCLPNSPEARILAFDSEMKTCIKQAIDTNDVDLVLSEIRPLASDIVNLRYAEVSLSIASGRLMGLGESALYDAATKYKQGYKLDSTLIKNLHSAVTRDELSLDDYDLLFLKLSIQTLRNSASVNNLIALITDLGLDINKICWRISEGDILSNLDMTISSIITFEGFGSKISMDNYGADIASYSFLKVLPVHFIAFEKNLIANISNDKADYLYVESIEKISKHLGGGIQLIAKEISSVEQLETLEGIGIDCGAGQFFGQARVIHCSQTDLHPTALPELDD